MQRSFPVSPRAWPLSGLWLCLLAAAPAWAQDAARITRVTLYPGSATVERVARVAPGAGALEIEGLPAGFDARTLRLMADANVRLGELTVQDVARTESPNPHRAGLERQIEALDDRIAKLEVERKSAELVTGYLKGLGAGERNAVDARGLPGTLSAIRQGGADALARMQQVAEQRRPLDKQRAALQRELERAAADSRDTRRVRVSLASERGGEVRLSYQIDGPGWQPVYRAALDSASGRVELERQALIAQNSGEDWSNVALRLSTGQPRNAAAGVPPQPWLLGLSQPRPLPLAKSMPAAAPPAMMARMEADRANAPLFEVGEIQTAFATEFEVPARVSLPSDGRRVTVSLGRQQLAAKLRVQVVPRQQPVAWLIASADRLEGVWLPGDVQLYRDGAYTGATHWAPQDGERLELPFGQDDRVTVAVRDEPRQEGDGGLLGQRRQRTIASEYTITSRHARPVDLLVLEPSPVGTDAALQVDTRFTPSPEQTDWQGQRGVVAWQRTLAPGASERFAVRYVIAWPREATLVGD